MKSVILINKNFKKLLQFLVNLTQTLKVLVSQTRTFTSKLTEEHLAIQELTRDFANKHLKPNASKLDLEGRFPFDEVSEILISIKNKPYIYFIFLYAIYLIGQFEKKNYTYIKMTVSMKMNFNLKVYMCIRI